VRYIANRSSGRQGHAIASALARLGADVTLVSGPVTIADPVGVTTVHVERADEMRDAVLTALPADIAVMVAAVADWRVASASDQKIKKHPGESIPTLALTENPDILKTIGHHTLRPKLVVGFAADMIVANDVSPATGIMGGVRNRVKIVSRDGIDQWPDMAKEDVATKLAELIAERLRRG
jgi:phosphopantothenoylcysteine decarboxylase/phosphopantothenate--cysteine ligase